MGRSSWPHSEGIPGAHVPSCLATVGARHVSAGILALEIYKTVREAVS